MTVNPFPVENQLVWPALPASEYYGLIRLPKSHQPPFGWLGEAYL